MLRVKASDDQNHSRVSGQLSIDAVIESINASRRSSGLEHSTRRSCGAVQGQYMGLVSVEAAHEKAGKGTRYFTGRSCGSGLFRLCYCHICSGRLTAVHASSFSIRDRSNESLYGEAHCVNEAYASGGVSTCTVRIVAIPYS